MSRETFCGPGKGTRVLTAKETMIVSARNDSATFAMTSKISALSPSIISKHCEKAMARLAENDPFRKLANSVAKVYTSAV